MNHTLTPAAPGENPYDGNAAVIVPQAVEKLPLFHWRPGARLLAVGSRAGTNFTPDLHRDEGSSFQRPFSAALLAEVLVKMPVAGVVATWCDSLWFPRGLATLAACELPLIIATSGQGDPLPWLDKTAAWILWIDAAQKTPPTGVRDILGRGRHVEIVLGVDGSALPDLPYENAAAVHLVPRQPSADPVLRRDWYVTARARLAGLPVYDEDHAHTECGCGAHLVWRSGGRSRIDALTPAGTCQGCGRAAGIVLS